jgi:hypothetical protein
MSSIFDGITQPTLTLDSVGNAGVTAPAESAPRLAASAEHAAPSVAAAPAGDPSTGLLAVVAPEEFLRLCSEPGPPLVLHQVVNDAAAAQAGGVRQQAPQRSASHRYIVSRHGTIFVASSPRSLPLPEGLRMVECIAALHHGTPIGREDRIPGA